MTDKCTYPMVIYREETSDGTLWIGNFPGLNGCWAEGASEQEVISRASGVLRQYADACREMEWQIPEAPTVKELEAANAGKVILITEA